MLFVVPRSEMVLESENSYDFSGSLPIKIFISKEKWNLLLTFLCIAQCTLYIRIVHLSVGLVRRGGNNSVDLSLHVLLYSTSFINK